MTGTLERRPYGCTGEQVSIIGLGGSFLHKHSFDQGVATVRHALEMGVSYFDTSPAYGEGKSQLILGEALEGRPEPYMLATKLAAGRVISDTRSNEALRAQLHDNLRALRREQVDVLMAHNMETTYFWEDGVEQPWDERELFHLDRHYDFSAAPVMQVLREARAEGHCRFIGGSADASEQLAHFLREVAVDACLSAHDYTLLRRQSARFVMPVIRELGIAYIVGAVFSSTGIPEGRSQDERLNVLAKRSGISLATLTIRYLIANREISTILVGASTPEELEESVVAAEAGTLPPDLHHALEELGEP